jgi:4-hydroxy-3-polyprenylbenzoate decarboxylase
MNVRRLVVGISGVSGVIYGIRLLSVLSKLEIERHVIMTKAAEKVIQLETEFPVTKVKELSTKFYDVDNVAASIASGSFPVDGMVVVPCSMKSLAGIASGYSANLLLRAADVTLKEKRPLVLVVREMPFSAIHIQNMLKLASIGVTILPAAPGYYHKPKTIDDLVDHVVGKVLDVLNIKHNLYERWGEHQ